jgi:hypothetical protein
MQKILYWWCLSRFLISHNPKIRQEINGNGLKHVADFVSFSIFSFCHRDMIVANGYMTNGQRGPCLSEKLCGVKSSRESGHFYDAASLQRQISACYHGLHTPCYGHVVYTHGRNWSVSGRSGNNTLPPRWPIGQQWSVREWSCMQVSVHCE